jgi:spore maturation protein CgeB
MNGYKDRNDYLNHLMANSGAYIHRDGGQRERNLSPKEYAEAMQKSKISLSFSNTRNCLHQTKGRIWEVTLCGAMLMEDNNQGTQLWFDPYRDYVPFNSKEDLVDKTNYYLNHSDKMTEIANNGKNKSEMHYSARNWWSIVFNKCGVKH